MSHVICHVSHVTCQFFNKVQNLVGGLSVINGLPCLVIQETWHKKNKRGTQKRQCSAVECVANVIFSLPNKYPIYLLPQNFNEYF